MFFVKKKYIYNKTNVMFKYYKYSILLSSKHISLSNIKKRFLKFKNLIRTKKMHFLNNLKQNYNLSNSFIGFLYLYGTNNILNCLDFFFKNKNFNLILIIREKYIVKSQLILKNFFHIFDKIISKNIYIMNLLFYFYFYYLSKTLEKYVIFIKFFNIEI